MPQLLVRNIEEKVVRKLKESAGVHRVSTEQEHRRILRKALLGPGAKRASLKEYLRQMPDVRPNELFERSPQPEREVAF